ncbi:MAG TPA: hypothetical protein VNF68_10410 [Candidatus Baltobacteraceae bacterium]|nr:hypothetical protein [Candidatus Baltobacteraceae bacterium]
MDLSKTTISVRTVGKRHILAIHEGTLGADIMLDAKKTRTATSTLGPRATQGQIIFALLQDGIARVVKVRNGIAHIDSTEAPETPPEAA